MLPAETQVEILNLARDCVIRLFKTLKKQFKGQENMNAKEKFKKKIMRYGGASSRAGGKRGSKSEASMYNTSQQNKAKREQENSQNSSYSSEKSDDEEQIDSEADLDQFNIDEEIEFLQRNAGYSQTDSN